MRSRLFCAFLFILLASVEVIAKPSDGVEFFESKIRPLLADNCFACHGPKMQMAGLNLSTAAGLLKGSEKGPVVIKGNPDASRLIQAVGYEGALKMPPDGKLKDQQIADLKEWVRIGAPWPESATTPIPGSTTAQRGVAEQEFWSFRLVQKITLPPVRNSSWVRTPVDLFILAKLQSKGLEPAPSAEKLA